MKNREIWSTPEWSMPEWMEKYRDSIISTGGNKIEKLMVDKTPMQINVGLAACAIAVKAQIGLLENLHKMDLLK